MTVFSKRKKRLFCQWLSMGCLSTEISENFGTLDEFVKLMTELPEWATGLPIDAQDWEREEISN